MKYIQLTTEAPGASQKRNSQQESTQSVGRSRQSFEPYSFEVFRLGVLTDDADCQASLRQALCFAIKNPPLRGWMYGRQHHHVKIWLNRVRGLPLQALSLLDREHQ